MDLEKLIELVKEHDFLFDYNDKGYHDMPKKDMVWKSIGRKLCQNPEECKKQWTTLRDGFRRHLRKRKKKSSNGSTKKWRYEDEMTFLLPFMQKRAKPGSRSAITIKIEDEELDPENISQTSEMNHSGEETNDCQHSDKSKNSDNSNDTRKHAVPVRRKFIKSKPTNTSTLLMKYLLDKKNEKQDETEALFYSLAQTVKKMDPYHRSLAKSKVCSIIGELELQCLSYQSPPITSEVGSCNSPPYSFENVSLTIPSPVLSSSDTNEGSDRKNIMKVAEFHDEDVERHTAGTSNM